MATGLTEVEGKEKYFYDNGYQAKGIFIPTKDGHLMFFCGDSGEVSTQASLNKMQLVLR
ncbi:MAG: hypothetical protein ACLU93_01115 [Streptococcus sp.]